MALSDLPMWQYSKIIEQDKDGVLHLLHDNLERVLEPLKKQIYKNDKTIQFIAFVGPPRSGKSFFTNMLAAYLKFHENFRMLDKSINDNGLKGFMFGDVTHKSSITKQDSISEIEERFLHNSVEKTGIFTPNDFTGGIYLWPEWIQLGDGKTVVGILHIQESAGTSIDTMEIKFSLNVLLGITCATIIDIQWDDMSIMSEVGSLLTKQKNAGLKKEQARDYQLINKSNKAFQNVKTKLFAFPEALKLSHDGYGKLERFTGKQSRLLQRMLEDLTEAIKCPAVHPSKNLKTVNNVKDYLAQQIQNVNSCKEFRISSSSLPALSKAYVNSQSESSDKKAADTLANQPVDNAKVQNIIEITDKNMQKVLKSKWKLLELNLGNFISNELNIKNVSYFKILHERWQKDVESLKLSKVSEGLDIKETSEIFEEMIHKMIGTMKRIIDDIICCLTSFLDDIIEYQEKYKCLSQVDLYGKISKLKESLPQDVENIGVRLLVERGCHVLFNDYKNEIEKTEERMLLGFMQNIRKFYQTTMRSMLPLKQCHDPDKYFDVHKTLSKNLVRIFEEILQQSNNERSKQLAEQLYLDFMDIHVQNLEKLVHCHSDIVQNIEKYTSRYEKSMKKILVEQNGNLDFSELDNQHLILLKDHKGRLASSVRKTVGPHVSTGEYLKVFENKINKWYQSLMESIDDA